MRARWLKPEFFTDKKIAALGMAPALVFEALGCVADDGGVAQCDALSLKGQMFMRWDELTVEVVERALAVLTEAGQVQHYVIEDRDFYRLLVWDEKAIHNPSKFRHPRPAQPLTPPDGETLPQGGGSTEAVGAPSSHPIHLDSPTPQHPDTSTTGITIRERVREALPAEYRTDYDSLLDTALGKASERESWLRSLHAVLFDGYDFPSRDPEQLGQGLREMLGTQGAPTWRKYAGFVRKLTQKSDPPPPANKSTGAGIGPAVKLAAAQQLEEIQKLKVGSQTLHGTKYHIPVAKLEELPPAVKSAIAALGGSLTSGAQRIIDCPGDKYSILLGQFQTLYAGAIQTERARIGAHA